MDRIIIPIGMRGHLISCLAIVAILFLHRLLAALVACMGRIIIPFGLLLEPTCEHVGATRGLYFFTQDPLHKVGVVHSIRCILWHTTSLGTRVAEVMTPSSAALLTYW